MSDESVLQRPSRLASLDVFRGITIAAMILVNNPGASPSYAPLEHAAWHGWTLTDLIFPFFLFIVGVAIPFSFAKRSATASKTELLGHIWVRALALFMLGQLLFASNLPLPLRGEPDGFVFTKLMRVIGFAGVYGSILALLWPWRSRRLSTWLPIGVAIVFYGYWVAMHYIRLQAIGNGWPEATFGAGIFNPDKLRIPGVLQRIGICYGIAATIAFVAGWRTVLASAALFCAMYATLMLATPLTGHVSGSLTKEDNFARHIDVGVLNFAGQVHTYGAYPDPEGIVSTLPAIASVLMGVLVGQWLRTSRSPLERCGWMLAMSLPTIAIGLALDRVLMPINKSLWTPSYTVFSAGCAMLVLGVVFWICDVKCWRRWALPFTIFGMNAIAAFVLSSLVLRMSRLFPLTDAAGKPVGFHSLFNRQLTAGMQSLAETLDMPGLAMSQNLSLAYALCFVTLIFVIVAVMYVRQIFVKV